jgi:serine/threonine-protein kinase
MEDATRALEAGTVIAERYRIEALLGEGGMGAVYKVVHIHMHKAFALKLLHPALTSSPEVLARFEREAQAAAAIDHPNVAHATDFGRLADGSFFLVLEHVAGSNLRDVVERGPIPTERAFAITRQILLAVAAAHAKGIVHRDLKPENVMLTDREGQADFVKVLDFGIAKVNPADEPRGGSAQPLTRMGAIIGTPDYMAPEQAMGRSVDHRADLYAIGVMLYEMLSGGRPFQGGIVTVMRQHVVGEVPPLPDAVVARVDPRAQGLLRELLAKTPEGRPESAVEVIARLDELDATARIAAGGAPATSSTSMNLAKAKTAPELDQAAVRRARSPLRLVLAMLAVLAGFAVLGVVVVFVLSGEARREGGERSTRSEAPAANAKQVTSSTRAPADKRPSGDGPGGAGSGKAPEKKCNTRLPLLGCVD